jgi:integrase
MARALNRLSDRRMKAAAPGMHCDGGNLWLHVADSGARSWLFRFAIGGRERAMGLGAVNAVSLAQARQKAADARNLVADGIDPIEARASARASRAAAVTFEAVARDYLAIHGPALSVTYRLQWESTLASYAYPQIGSIPVAAVDVDAVFRVLSPLWPTKADTASRLRGRIEAILGAATVRGLRAGPNPATWRGNLAHLLPKKSKVHRVAHRRAMPYRDLPAFMATLRAREGAAARAFELLILTALRTGEVLGARWAEIDVAEALWTIPGERMKARKPHRIPLSGPALAVLAALPRTSEFVFPAERRAGKPMHSDALAETLERMKVEVTTHGFRSTFRDWSAEQTGFSNEVCEAALAHTVGNSVGAAYRRGDLLDKRRELMNAWGTFCGAAS